MLIVDKEKKRNGHISNVCDKHTIVGQYNDKSPVYLDEIADVIYDYAAQEGYSNLNKWVEEAVKKH